MKNIATWAVLILTFLATIGGGMLIYNGTGNILSGFFGGILIGFAVLFIGGLSVSWY